MLAIDVVLAMFPASAVAPARTPWLAAPAGRPESTAAPRHDCVQTSVGRATRGAADAPALRADLEDEEPWTPSVAIWESDREVLLCVDVPDVTPESMAVQLEGRALVVSGEGAAPCDASGVASARRRPFRRQIALPSHLVQNELSTTLRDGVLEVRIPRAPAPAVALAVA
jgi:HSP20 family protein